MCVCVCVCDLHLQSIASYQVWNLPLKNISRCTDQDSKSLCHVYMYNIQLFMLAECHPKCQPPHSLHETTQTQILLLWATKLEKVLPFCAKYCRLKMFDNDLPWWHGHFTHLAPFLLGLYNSMALVICWTILTGTCELIHLITYIFMHLITYLWYFW